MKLFFSVQLGHLKLSGYGLLSTQGVQNRSQNCWIVSQSEVILQYVRDPGAPAELGPKGVNGHRRGAPRVASAGSRAQPVRVDDSGPKNLKIPVVILFFIR